MKTIAVIAEFDPFHNGHAYLLRRAREQFGADKILILQSGEFLQRGLPAAWSARRRAEMALCGGADLILEQSSRFVLESAESYGYCAIRLLDRLSCVDAILFASESGDIDELLLVSSHLQNETAERQALIRSSLREGMSLAKARAEAFPEFGQILSAPNNLLALSYLDALRKLRSKIVPYTVQRIGSAHHDAEIASPYASAGSIRRHCASGRGFSGLSKVLPEKSLSLLQNESMLEADDLSPALLYALHRCASYRDLLTYRYFDKDLARRIFRLRDQFISFTAFIDEIHNRSLTKTRIQRALLSLALDLKKDPQKDDACYAHLLGMRKDASDLLSRIRENAAVPVLVRPASEHEALPEAERALFDEDLRLTSYALALRAQKAGVTAEDTLKQALLTV